jgi:hypothetical protein
MKERVFRYLPIVSGLLLGWLLASPPAFLDGLGPLRYGLAAALVGLLLVALTGVQILANLPADIRMAPLADAPDVSVSDLVTRLGALGFVAAGPPLRVEIAPPATLVPLVNEAEQCYATVFRTGTVPAKTAYDFVSILQGDRGGLTSGPEPGGTALPAAPGSLRQAFPGATPEQVFAHHREAAGYLRGRGLSLRRVSAASFAADFRESFRRQRAAFLRSPLTGAITTLWRASTGRSPHVGPIRQQKVAEAAIRALQTGRVG